MFIGELKQNWGSSPVMWMPCEIYICQVPVSYAGFCADLGIFRLSKAWTGVGLFIARSVRKVRGVRDLVNKIVLYLMKGEMSWRM